MKAINRSRDVTVDPAQTVNRRRRLSPMNDSPDVESAAPLASESHDPLPTELQQHRVMSSSCGDGEGHAEEKACPSYFACSGCEEVLHELANVMAGVLTNAQMVGWKLPPYSHLKRSVREVERNAQRGGELLKRLINRTAARDSARQVQS